MRRRERGFTLLEFGVAGVILSVLAFILLDRLAYYQDFAEKTAVEMTIMNMRSGLRYRVAEMLLHGQEAELPGLASENPVKWLEKRPPQYVGEGNVLHWSDLPPGSWGFDKNRRELIYRVKGRQDFVSAKSDEQGLRLHVRLLKGTPSQSGQERVVGAELVLVENYRWF